MKLRLQLSLVLMIWGYGLFAQPHSISVFSAGENGVHTFRIPAIVQTRSGVLLAFSEARWSDGGDTGDIDLVLKRSTDGGKTWGEMITVWDDEQNVCGNPCPVVDRRSGDVILLATWNLGCDKEKDIHDRTSVDTRRVFCLRSGDEGLTWSAPKEITGQVKKQRWTWYATGPCHAIQLRDGRLVAPCNHGVYRNGRAKGTSSHIIYSDDEGYTWRRGGNVGVGNESTVVELSDGRLMINMRNWVDGKKKSSGYVRLVSVSRNRGRSFGRWYREDALVEPVCQGSLISASDLLVFSNPRDSMSRKNLSLMISRDNGNTWAPGCVVTAGPSAYSDLVWMDEGTIGVLYEGGSRKAHEGIRFSRISLNDSGIAPRE